MIVSGTWGIANGRAHRDAAYDANSNNTIGVSGTPLANRGCDGNWLYEGACPPPVPSSPSGYATDNTYEYNIGNGKTGGYSISFTDGAYGDNTGALTFKLYETTSSASLGVTTLAYSNTSTSTTGGTISGSTLTLAAASASNPGLVSTGAQTFAGAKTFSTEITAVGYKIPSGLSSQYLMADGSVSTLGTTSSQTLLNTYAKPMTSGWSQTLPATDPTKTYKMVVSGTWGIANGRAHRDAAYDANSNNTIGVSGTPVANRGCDGNWLFEGACPPPVPSSPSGYASDNTYEYNIGNGKTGGYSISFTDGAYGDNTGSLTFKLYETTTSSSLGVTTLAYSNTSTSTTGGTISGSTLTLAAASASNPGLVSTGAQTFAGAKTFSNDVTATNFLGNASTATALAAGKTISTTGDITYTSGSFNGSANVTGVATLTNSGVVSGTYGSSSAMPTFTVDSKGRITAAGTISLTATTSIPYTGATGAVNLGAYDLTVNGLTIGMGLAQLNTNTALGRDVLFRNTTGSRITAIGTGVMEYNTVGGDNTGVGWQALNRNTSGAANTVVGSKSLNINTTGNFNSVFGSNSMEYNISGNDNSAIGAAALYQNTTGSFNTAIGNNALYSNKGNEKSVAIGHNAMFYADDRTAGRTAANVAIGYEALKGSAIAANNTGINNTAVGYLSMTGNTSGYGNSALGTGSLTANTTGAFNTSIGTSSLNVNTLGDYNVGLGYQSLVHNTTADFNVAIGGRDALFTNITGENNIAVGTSALYTTNASNNTAVGHDAGYSNTSGTDNIFIGKSSAGFSATSSNQIVIGTSAIGIGSNTTIIGNSATTSAELKGTLKSNGQILAIATKSAAYTALVSDEIIIGDASSAAFTITLPTAVGKNGQTYTIKRINSVANVVTVGTTSSQTIDGAATYALSAQYKYVKVVSDGSNWIIVGNN